MFNFTRNFGFAHAIVQFASYAYSSLSLGSGLCYKFIIKSYQTILKSYAI